MWPYPKVLAHRGGGTLAPENTLAGVRRGLRAGFRAIEYDVMLARDGVPVVIHDPFLGRTVAGSGHVADYDALELAAMDAGSWFAAAFKGEPVPLFVEFAQYCKAHGVWMNIEIKPAAGADDADRRCGGAHRPPRCSPTNWRPGSWRRRRCCPRSARARWKRRATRPRSCRAPC